MAISEAVVRENVIDVLRARGLVDAVTNEDIGEVRISVWRHDERDVNAVGLR